ncbi:hypothetical protein MAX20_28245 [Escherichia coli]
MLRRKIREKGNVKQDLELDWIDWDNGALLQNIVGAAHTVHPQHTQRQRCPCVNYRESYGMYACNGRKSTLPPQAQQLPEY